MSLQNCTQNDPFIIIYNHRNAPKLQNDKKTAKRRHHDYSTLPHSIIITRRMAAQIQNKKQQVQILMESQMFGLYNSKSGQLGIREDVNFFDQEDLDRCIPMDEVPQEQITYNLNDLTLSSNYSKLERTLCGIGVTAFQEDMSEDARPVFDD